ncbi:MAG: hypothetical protein ACTXOO_01800 [Sodalis sp. (in: enterobacteria)]
MKIRAAAMNMPMETNITRGRSSKVDVLLADTHQRFFELPHPVTDCRRN